MIRIIEENESVLLATCDACLSKFTLDINDIVYLEPHYCDRGVECPICKNKVYRHGMKRVAKREIDKLLKEGGSNE